LAIRFRLLLLACLAFPHIASAGWIQRSGEPLADTAYRKSDGQLISWLVFVANDRKLSEAWLVPGESVNIDEIESVDINSPISGFVVFGGCKGDDSGNCNVQMRYRVLAPDGSTYAQSPTMEVWVNKPQPPNRSLQLSVDYLKVVVEPHEQDGTYTVQVQINDVNAGKNLFLERAFHARKAKKANFFDRADVLSHAAHLWR
jgi:hypothetical protein